MSNILVDKLVRKRGFFWIYMSVNPRKQKSCLKYIHSIYFRHMETNIQKWGNSLGVRLPKSIAVNKSLKEGSRVVVSETKTGISIEVVKRKRPTLNELLKGVTKENLHPETDWGEPVGNEIW